MKKLKKKIQQRRKSADQPQESPARITNETVAEHRERILAGGRKFKYPHQYVRHRLVINAIIIGVVALIVTTALGWWQLYKAHNTSEFVYRITKVLPLPVGSVDGETLRYSDYLMRYRSTEQWLRNQGQLGLNGNDETTQLNFYKRQVMDELIADGFAEKQARSLKISVSDQEIQSVVDDIRKTSTGEVSEDVYEASAESVLGYSSDELRHLLGQSLLRQKVVYAMDTKARAVKDEVATALKAKNVSLEKVAAAFKKQNKLVEYGASGWVPRNNHDNGLSRTALTLKNGQISDAIMSTIGDGYYFVQRLGANDQQVNYQYIKVGLSEFNAALQKIKAEHKVQEYIEIPKQGS